MKPFFSIITATFNCEKTLLRSISSVRQQTFRSFEYIIIDGGSTDSTVEKIKNNQSTVTTWLSEKDQGIYDAWNKGISLAKGSWILFIGADDFLYPEALQSYYDFLANSVTTDVLYLSSKVEIIDHSGHIKRIYGWPWKWRQFRRINLLAHPGSLQSKKLFDQYGLYNISYKIVGDYELLLRPREKLNGMFMNKITAKVTEGGMSYSYRTFLELRRAVSQTAGIPDAIANYDFVIQILKLWLKNVARRMGINLYLRK